MFTQCPIRAIIILCFLHMQHNGGDLENMTAKLLEKHITDTIREWQVKIGYEGGTMKLYYPAESLRRSLSLDETEDLAKALSAFCKNVQPRLGMLAISAVKDRYCVLALIHTPDDIMDASLLYLNIYIYGLPFMFFYNIATGIFSALGDSRTPFIFLAISSVSNIFVDILFVKSFQMGIAGVAWATFLCQGVSAILAVTVVIRRLIGIKTDGRFRFFDGSILKQILVVAIPSTLQQSFISIGNIIIQSVINDFGTSVIAGYSAAVKLNNLVITSLTTLGNGISNYTAQNIGAGKIDRIRSGFKASLKLVWLLCIPFALLYFTCGRWLLLLFLDNPTATAIKTGIVFLCILAPFYFIVSIKLMADGILRGAGIMNKFMISTFTDLILRVVLSIIFSKMFGSVGIWCSWPVGWCCGTAVSVLFYRGEQKRNFKNAFEA